MAEELVTMAVQKMQIAAVVEGGQLAGQRRPGVGQMLEQLMVEVRQQLVQVSY
jgi:hypothetical protein